MASVNMTVDGVTKQTTKLRFISSDGNVKEALLEAITENDNNVFEKVDINWETRSSNEGALNQYGDLTIEPPQDNGTYIGIFRNTVTGGTPPIADTIIFRKSKFNGDRYGVILLLSHDYGVSEDSTYALNGFILKSSSPIANNGSSWILEDGRVRINGSSKFILANHQVQVSDIEWFKIGGGE